MDNEVRALLEDVVGLLQIARCEIKALQLLLVEKHVLTPEELEETLERATQRERRELDAEVLRRANEILSKWRLEE